MARFALCRAFEPAVRRTLVEGKVDAEAVEDTSWGAQWPGEARGNYHVSAVPTWPLRPFECAGSTVAADLSELVSGDCDSGLCGQLRRCATQEHTS